MQLSFWIISLDFVELAQSVRPDYNTSCLEPLSHILIGCRSFQKDPAFGSSKDPEELPINQQYSTEQSHKQNSSRFERNTLQLCYKDSGLNDCALGSVVFGVYQMSSWSLKHTMQESGMLKHF